MDWRWIACALVCCFSCTSESTRKLHTSPNFILVLVDDQAWNGTSVEMVPGMAESASDFHETPHLESLAAKGMRFSNAELVHPFVHPLDTASNLANLLPGCA